MSDNYICSFTFLEESNIVLIKYQGQITLKNTLKAIDEIQAHPSCTPDYNFLVDVRDAGFAKDISIVRGYYKYVNRTYPHILDTTTVWLANEASQVVMVTLFKLSLGRLKRNSTVCSTLNYAINKLNPSLNKKEIEFQLDNL